MDFRVGDEIENIGYYGNPAAYPKGAKYIIVDIKDDKIVGRLPKLIIDIESSMYFLPYEVKLVTNKKLLKRSGSL